MLRTSVLWRIHLYLAVFAQLGILTRLVIGRLFSGPCSGNGRWSWAPCVTGSGLMSIGDTLFYDFPANVLGSFFIGLLSSGSSLAVCYPSEKLTNPFSRLAMPIFPGRSNLQNCGELHLGLRTGYCGSLTTFSSWFMQVVVLMVGRGMPPGSLRGTHWVQGLWAIYLGMSGPLLALVLGQHAAVAAAALWAGADQASRPPQHGASRNEDAVNCPAAPDGSRMQMTTAETTVEGEAAQVEEPALEVVPAVVLEVVVEPKSETLDPTSETAVSQPRSSADVPPLRTSWHPQAPPLKPRLQPRAASLRRTEYLLDLAAGAILLTLTGVSLAYAYLDRNTPAEYDRRFWWFSILLGPVGCFVRWYLSHLNGWRDGWLQHGTFAANVLGCILDYVCEALLFRLNGSLSHTQRMVLQGLMVGTAGCLTTVSTYVVEVQKLSMVSPPMAYKYFLASTVVPVVLGILIYGIPVWLGTTR